MARTLTARLAPALPAAITHPGMLPAAPAWFPLDPKPTDTDPHPAPYTDEERAARRAAWALSEALAGPFDGTRLRIDLADNQAPPARFVPEQLPEVWYNLDEQASTPHGLVYRYDPGCYLHGKLIAAVEDGFREHADEQYALQARLDDEDAPGYDDAHPTEETP